MNKTSRTRSVAQQNNDLRIAATWWFINNCKTPAELREVDPALFGRMTDQQIAEYVIRDYMERNAKPPAE